MLLAGNAFPPSGKLYISVAVAIMIDFSIYLIGIAGKKSAAMITNCIRPLKLPRYINNIKKNQENTSETGNMGKDILLIDRFYGVLSLVAVLNKTAGELCSHSTAALLAAASVGHPGGKILLLRKVCCESFSNH
ncbi:hypothetical protein ACSBR2_021254 [Camellia fascicularis]